MSKFFRIALLSLLCIGTSPNLLLQAQDADRKWGLGVGLNFRDFNSIPNQTLKGFNLSPAFRGYLSRYLSPSFDIHLETTWAPPQQINPEYPKDLNDIDLNLRYKLANGYILKERAVFAPYINLGGGVSIFDFENPQVNVLIPAGIGFKLMGFEGVSADFNALYKYGLTDPVSYFVINSGITIHLGKDPTPVPEPPKDTDGDGIADELDACPELAGYPDLNGCPDQDDDGIPDPQDACPEIKGLAELNGCPNTDQDEDGIPDDEDECPTEAGISAFGGCPDTDADGIADKDDDCPTEPGIVTMGGCPDRDEDGIRDSEDVCPDVPGVAAQKGCPEIEEEVKEKLKNIASSVKFESGSDILRNTSYAVLDEVVALVREYPDYMVRVSGHTDSQGEADFNLQLSEDRARVCAQYMIDQGIDPEKVVYLGYGEARPVADNFTDEGRAANRRVEFELFIP